MGMVCHTLQAADRVFMEISCAAAWPRDTAHAVEVVFSHHAELISNPLRMLRKMLRA